MSSSFLPSGVHFVPVERRKSSAPIICSWPLASSFTHTWKRSSLSCFEYEIHFPSGENCAPVTLPASLCPTTSVFPLSMSTIRSVWSDPLHNSDFESGDHTTPL